MQKCTQQEKKKGRKKSERNIRKISKKVHSGSAVTRSKQVLKAARNWSMLSGATVILTWRLMPWKACESWMWVDMILLFDAASVD